MDNKAHIFLWKSLHEDHAVLINSGDSREKVIYRSEGFPERDIWSLHVMDQGSCQIGRVLGTSPSPPPPSPGSSG